MKTLLDKIAKNNLLGIPSIQHVFKVSELFNYDMIYIYHHIQEGTKVNLVRDELQIGGKYRYFVYYKDYQLGSLFVSSFFSAQYGNLKSIEAEVTSITKEKYMPIKHLDVLITQASLRLVS
ncbi:MAG: hypothetical protein AB8B74_14830 [Crocinitomicaceae bacterium]